MAYLVKVPDTDVCNAYEPTDFQTTLIASICGVPDFAVENVRMVHRVPKTKYVSNRHNDKKKFDKFVMWSFQGKPTPEQLEEAKKNPLFLEDFYDGEPIDLCTFWYELTPELDAVDTGEE